MEGAEIGVPASRRRWVRHWRWPLLAVWVLGIVLIFGPITDATGSLNPPPVEDAVQGVLTVGMLATVILILLGRRFGALLGAMCAAGGMGVGVADIPQVGGIGTAELAVFSVLLAASLYGWHVAGAARVLHRREGRAAQDDGVIPLRRYQVSWRHPKLQIQGSDLVITVPTYFGRISWRVPCQDVAVFDLQELSLLGVSTEGTFFEELRIPYLVTTTPRALPNVMLLFRESRPMPRLRWSRLIFADGMFGSLRQRLRDDVRVDGVALRCVDPNGAIRTLSAGGVDVTHRPIDWMAQRRRLVVDEAERRELISRIHRSQRVRLIAAVVSAIALITLLLGQGGLLPQYTWIVVAVIGGVVQAAARRIRRR